MSAQLDLATYGEDGYVLVRNVFDRDTLEELRQETDALLEGAVPVEARLADVLLFSYFTVHGSYVINPNALEI